MKLAATLTGLGLCVCAAGSYAAQTIATAPAFADFMGCHVANIGTSRETVLVRLLSFVDGQGGPASSDRQETLTLGPGYVGFVTNNDGQDPGPQNGSISRYCTFTVQGNAHGIRAGAEVLDALAGYRIFYITAQ